MADVRYRWYHKVGAVLLSILCFYVGLFLLVIPWTRYWDYNYFSHLPALVAWRAWWTSGYVRGLISGLGMVNLYVSFHEVFRLRRFAETVTAESRI